MTTFYVLQAEERYREAHHGSAGCVFRRVCRGPQLVVSAAGGRQTIYVSSLTICVHDYAKVDETTTQEAEAVASGIFRKVGVGIRWVHPDQAWESSRDQLLGEDAFPLSHILLNIYPVAMEEHLDALPNSMGLAPGNGTDRTLVYVFYNRVETVSQKQMRARQDGEIRLFASKSAILSYAIVHELGHLLLNLEVHSMTGIMRGRWDRKVLTDNRRKPVFRITAS